MQTLKGDQSLVMSYLTLRKVIGVMGAALPFVMPIGGLVIFRTGLQISISAYYWTGMRDVFVGILWAIGFFLLSYRGYEEKDDFAGNLGCLFAIGMALFPTTPATDPSELAMWIGGIHFGFAAAFFVTLIYFSAVLFTKTNPDFSMTDRKRQRNNVYRGCAVVMGLCIALLIIYVLLPAGTRTALDVVYPVFWLESAAIIAFGISWLTKGEAILADEEEPQPAPSPAAD